MWRTVMSTLLVAVTRDLAHAHLGARMAVPNCEMRDAAHRSLPATSPCRRRAASLDEDADVARAAAAVRSRGLLSPCKEDLLKLAV